MVGPMANFKSSTCDELVQRAKIESSALGTLYDRYYERIYRFLLLRVYLPQKAEDLTSEVFLTIAKKIRTFQGDSEKDFRNWIYAIAANHANSYIRKNLRRKQLFENYMEQAHADQREQNADDLGNLSWSEMYTAIARLKPLHQTIVTLRFFENMEFEEIGKIVNKKPATVRVALHRIINKLRCHLENSADGSLKNV
jgi:RNA polymerase sigma-70 factor (ECF subfamily)